MNKWDEARKATEKTGGMWIRLKDGDSVKGVFRGDPESLYYSFDKKQYFQTKEPGVQYKFRINFIVKDGEEWVPKIFEQGVTALKTLIAVKNKYGLEESVFEISRTGSTKDDTQYNIMYEGVLGPKDKKAVDAVNLLDLSIKTKDEDEDLPF